MNLHYSTSTVIWLHLEDYHNAGLSSAETRKIIEGLADPIQRYGYSSDIKLSCFPMGLSGNWKVSGNAVTQSEVERTVEIIRLSLDIAVLLKEETL